MKMFIGFCKVIPNSGMFRFSDHWYVILILESTWHKTPGGVIIVDGIFFALEKRCQGVAKKDAGTGQSKSLKNFFFVVVVACRFKWL